MPLQKVLLLCVSKDYMHLKESNPAEKWFCMYELADAINAINTGKIESDKAVVVFLSNELDNGIDDFIDDFQEQSIKNFNALSSHFLNLGSLESRQSKHSMNRKLSDHYAMALDAECMYQFFTDRTRKGDYRTVTSGIKEEDLTSLVDLLKSELGMH